MSNGNQVYTFTEGQVIRASGLLSLLMQQASGVGIGLKGLDGRYQLANQTMEALFGKSAEQIVGATDADLLSPEIAAQLQLSDRRIADGAAAASDELDFSIDGAPVRCLCLKFPVQGPKGKVRSIGAVMLDISRRDAVAEMRQTLERLQQTNQELQKTLVELDRLASTDKLTGAWNRRRLDEAVINEMARLRQYAHPLSLLIIDIDFFKNINDKHGHAAGDRILVELTAVLQSSLRATDSLTRWGGEEFVVLCPNTTLSTMARLGERLREKIARSVFPAAGKLTVSIGVAECMSEETWEQWFRRADAALYRAKAYGRNQIQVAPETPRRAGGGETVAAHFLHLSWHTAYECGHPVIDEQHRALFGGANTLLAAVLSGRPTDEVAPLVDALVGDVVRHFQDEEAIFTAAGFPGAADHVAIHHELVDHAVSLVGRFHAGTLGIGELFQFLAHDVVARHMLGADREFFPYLADHAREPSPPVPSGGGAGSVDWANQVVDAMPVAMFAIDAEHRITHWNRACELLTGVRGEDVVGTDQAWRVFYPETERPVLADLTLTGCRGADLEQYYPGKYQPSPLVEGGWDIEDFFPHFAEGGKWVIFSGAPLLAEDGRIVGAIETLVDITARKTAEAATRQTKTLLSEIIHGCPVPMFVIDADHRVVHWNRACEAIIGTPASEMVGSQQHWQPFYPEARPVMADLVIDGAEQLLGKYYSAKFRPSPLIAGGWEATDYFPHFPGGERWLYFTAAPLHGEDGAIIGAVETLQDITEQKMYEEMLERQARQDILTGLANRKVLEERLELALAQASRDGRMVAVAFIDLDHFKPVNDRLGHDAGDALLCELASRLMAAVRAVDTVARLGGDEFVVILSAPDSADAVRVVIERVIEEVGQPVDALGHRMAVGCSVGVALYPENGRDSVTLLRLADAAMYQAKEAGRNTYRFHARTNPWP